MNHTSLFPLSPAFGTPPRATALSADAPEPANERWLWPSEPVRLSTNSNFDSRDAASIDSWTK
jgi:hypothetical protein